MASNVLKAIRTLFDHCGIPLSESTTHRLKLADKKSVSPMANINAYGMGDSVTGAHADIIIADDIITIKDKISAAERTHTLDFTNEFFRLRKTPNSRIIITGTLWHRQDAWSRIAEFAPIKKYTVHECNWLDATTLEKENSTQDWMLNYLLEYPPDSDSVFNNITYGEFPLDTWKHTKVIMHIDAAYGGADTTAVTIMSSTHVLGKLYTGSYHNHLGKIIDLFTEYHCREIWCEDNDKGLLANDLKTFRVPVHTYHESRNKANKIISILKPSVFNALLFDSKTDDQYLDQIINWSYNTKDHDDAPDSLACCFDILNRNKVRVTGQYTF